MQDNRGLRTVVSAQLMAWCGSQGTTSNEEAETPLRVQDTRQVPLRRQLVKYLGSGSEFLTLKSACSAYECLHAARPC